MDRSPRGIYRALLRVYPAAFRQRFGQSMEVVFEREWKRARIAGTPAAFVFWIRLLADSFVNVPREWLDVAAHEGKGRVGMMLESLWQDLRYGMRGLVRRPALTLVLTLTLGLGIGGVTAIQSVLRGTLLRELPYDAPDRIHMFWNAGSWAPSDLAVLEEGSPTLSLVAAYTETQVVVQNESGPASAEDALLVSHDFFSVFGVELQRGRDFDVSDEVRGAPPVAVITHGLWVELGQRPDMVGSTLRIDGQGVEIVGITAPEFYFPDEATRMFRPMQVDRTSRDRYLSLITRVSTTATPETLAGEAQRVVTVLGRQIDSFSDAVRLTPVRRAIFGRNREPMILVGGALALVLLMAVINVGGLLLGHTERRRGELSLRAAIGASRSRLARQLVTESTIIGLLGGGAAVLFGLVGFKLLVGSLPISPGDAQALEMDRVFLLFTLLLGVGVGAVVGLIAALGSSAKTPGGSRGTTTGASRSAALTQNALVIAQVALTVLLVGGAGVMARSVGELSMIETGLSPGQAVVLDVVAGAGDYPASERGELYANLRGLIGEMPQTASVGLSQKLPLRGSGWTTSVVAPGVLDEPMFVPIRFVTPGYFEALGVPLASGRLPDSFIDRADGAPVAWVNQALAERIWPREDPAGQRSVTAWGASRRVAGVVGNVSEGNLTDAVLPAIYVLIEQHPRFLSFAMVARPVPGAGPQYPAQVVNLLREREPRLAVRSVSTFTEVEQAAQGDTLMIMRLLILLGVLALIVGAVGVHGVISQWVSGRIRGWAVALALGATSGTVLREVLIRSLSLTVAGVGAGIVLFLIGSSALESFLFGVERTDPVSLGATAALIVATGVLAAAAPALRAVRTDPVTLLRGE